MTNWSACVLFSSPIAEWRLPLLGVLLTGLGLLLLSAEAGETVLPDLPASATASSSAAAAPIPSRVAPVAPTRPVASRVWGRTWPGTGATILSAPGQSRRPVACLGGDLATGRRRESAHLASIALQRPAECGDLRDVITATAALTYAGRTTADHYPVDVADDPRQPGGIDLVATALFGPPDRQPWTPLEEEF